MKIAPLTSNDPWFAHVLNHGRAYVETLESVPVEVTVMMEQVDLFHSERSRNFRPLLGLAGQIVSVEAPSVELPYRISQMTFTAVSGPRMSAVYEFTDEQVVELVRKGYFESGFTAPSAMVGIPWVLPMAARLVFVQPDAKDEPPVVFLDFKDLDALRLNEALSGYQLADYFPDQRLPADLQVEGSTLDDLERPNLALDDGDLFADSQSVLAENPGVVSDRAREAAEERIAKLYREKVGIRLETEGLLSTAPASVAPSYIRLRVAIENPMEASHENQSMPLFDDGYLAFELEDGVLDEGDLGFAFDLDYVDLTDDEEEQDDIVAELEPHQRASFIDAAERAAATTNEALMAPARLSALRTERNVMADLVGNDLDIFESEELELG